MSIEAAELESAKFLSQFSGTRHSFLCYRHLAFGGKRRLQAISLSKGFVFIDLPKSPNGHGQPDAIHLGLAAGVGRLLGGHVGSQLAQMVVIGANSGTGTRKQVDQTFEMANDEDLCEIVRKRRSSFVVKYDEFVWVTIDPPRTFASTAGLIRFKAKHVGKVEVEAVAEHDMHDAIEVLESKLGDRVTTRAEFDPRKRKFKKRRG